MIVTAREVKLLKRCLEGDSQAFEIILEKYQGLICAITFSGTADVQQSEELAHQTFINAWKNLSQLKDLSKFRPWLCAIARNIIRDFLNQKQRDIIAKAGPIEHINDAAADDSGPLEYVIKKEHEALVSDAIGQLPELYREPLVLFYRQQQSIKQVAISLDLSESVVRQRLHRGREMIKDKLSALVEQTLSATGPKKVFTTAVMASITAIAVKSSAAAGVIAAASAKTGTTTAFTSVMSGVAAKIIAVAALVVIGVGAMVTYKQIIKPNPGQESSQAEITVRQQERNNKKTIGQSSDQQADMQAVDKPIGNLETGKSTAPPSEQESSHAAIIASQQEISEPSTTRPSEQETDILVVDDPNNDPNDVNLESKKSPATATKLPAVKNSIHLGVCVFDDETENPIEGAQLKVNPGCGCDSNCQPDYYATDDNGFHLINFGEKKPSYLSILVTKAGYVPTMFAWRDKMMENISDEFMFFLPRGKKIGGVITNKDSKPIPSVTVILYVPSDESKEFPWPRINDYAVTTDPNGRWQCDIFPDEPRQFSVKLKHSEYADTRIWVDDRNYKFKDFYSRQSVLVMEDGALLSGWVTNTEGTPIEGASVFTGEDRFNNDAPKTTTDSQGRFEFQHFLPQLQRTNVVLTVQAKGYAPELKVLPVFPGMQPVEIALSPPHTIRVRVVDPNGNPVTDALVDVDDWRKNRSVSWQSKTDDTGRFIWNEAPADEINIDISKTGYMSISEQMFVARQEEYQIVMSPPLIISGTVLDDETNEPIKDFTATKGIQWETGSLHWETPRTYGYDPDFTNGKYKLEMGHPYPGHLIRIDAEGYFPAKSRVFGSNEGSVTCDFRLKKGSFPSGIVHLPDGSPAANAEIYIVTPQRHLSFENGKPINVPDDTEWAVTNENGTFPFEGILDDTMYKFVIIHDEGFAEVSKQQWLMDPNITLQHWGRVEGTLFSGLKPFAGQVNIYDRNSHNNPDSLGYYFSTDAFADEDGNFVIEKAKPGNASICRKIVSKNGRSASSIHPQDIEIVPDQTTHVEIGGGGRPVTGTLIKPDWAVYTASLQYTNSAISPVQDKAKLYEIYENMEFPWPQGFDNMTVAQVMQWFQQWNKSDQGKDFHKEIEKRAKELQLQTAQYSAIIEPDGKFNTPDVLPGEYVLTSTLRKPDKWGNADYNEPIVAEIKHTFIVDDITEENQNIPVDLGTIEFTAPAKLQINAPVPDFSVRSFNGGTLKLADFQGKYLLLTFYTITDDESSNKDMANLKQIQDDFAGDNRFEMMGITHGGLPLFEELAKKFLAEQKLSWQQGFLQGSNYELTNTYQIKTRPSSFLIDPNGLLLAVGLKGDQLYQAVADALAE